MIDCLKHFVFNTTNVPLTCKTLYKNFRKYNFDDIAKHIIKYKGYFNYDYYKTLTKNIKHIQRCSDVFNIHSSCLNIGNKEIDQISLFGLENLTSICLNNMYIDTIIFPRNGLSNLKEITIVYSDLPSIDLSTSSFENVTSLIIIANTLSNLVLGSGFKNLIELDLSDNDFNVLDLTNNNFNKLEKFNISHNKQLSIIKFANNSFNSLESFFADNLYMDQLYFPENSFNKLEELHIFSGKINKFIIPKNSFMNLNYLNVKHCTFSINIKGVLIDV